MTTKKKTYQLAHPRLSTSTRIVQTARQAVSERTFQKKPKYPTRSAFIRAIHNHGTETGTISNRASMWALLKLTSIKGIEVCPSQCEDQRKTQSNSQLELAK